jgi:outer membrane protein, heavy metal efflux system
MNFFFAALVASSTISDPLLDRLIDESLAARPEIRAAEATLRAERERIPRASALPDPSFNVAFQNESFTDITLGDSEDTFFIVMGTQVFPWFPKLNLASDIASADAKQQAVGIERVRLDVEAEVRRAYLELNLARDRLQILTRLDALWSKSEGTARVRYESGEAPQSDVLRAQLELNRLRRRRWALEAEVRSSVQALNRLRSKPLDEPIETTISLREIGPPVLPAYEAAVADAKARSPELRVAEVGIGRAESAIDLAKWDRVPDFGVTAGVMPRAKELEPMWQVGVSFTLPLYWWTKQDRAIAENEARREASAWDRAAIEELLALRVKQRESVLSYLLQTIDLYRNGLLVQSDATVESTISQYSVGRVTFASVLEALVGYIADEEDYLAALADAQRIAIAALAVSLDEPSASGGAMAGRSIPGAGTMRQLRPNAAAAPAEGREAAPQMGGM